MSKTNNLEQVMVGVTGEYLVAGELSLRGLIASITLRNTRGIDIVASNKEGSRSLTIQVKSSSDTKSSWILNQKSETFYSENHFYVFVNLAEPGKRSKFFVVPSKVVAEYITLGHKQWLVAAGRNGNAHKDNSIRQFSDLENKYLEAWNLLEQYLN